MDGKPIVLIPEKKLNLSQNELNHDERVFYDIIFKRAQMKFNAYVKAGTVMKNYSSVLVMLLRLRQATCHPQLVTTYSQELAEITEKNRSADLKNAEKLLDKMPEDIVQRLLNDLEEENDRKECSVCLNPIIQGSLNMECGHQFCGGGCVKSLLDMDEDCPLCRGPMQAKMMVPILKFLERYRPDLVEKEIEEIKLQQKETDEDLALLRKSDFVSSTKTDKLLEICLDVRKSNPTDKIVVFSQFGMFLFNSSSVS